MEACFSPLLPNLSRQKACWASQCIPWEELIFCCVSSGTAVWSKPSLINLCFRYFYHVYKHSVVQNTKINIPNPGMFPIQDFSMRLSFKSLNRRSVRMEMCSMTGKKITRFSVPCNNFTEQIALKMYFSYFFIYKNHRRIKL